VVELGDGLWMVDLRFGGKPGVIAAYLLAGGGELALVETGPTSTLPALLDGIAAAGFDPGDLTAVLLTHIHLDHGGAAGVLLDRAPRATVRVHPRGLPHLVDPARLVASAGRIYGERMDELWGEVRPVPADRVAPLADGETLATAGRVITAVHTPGHASHHVAFWEPETGTAFTGDVGGIRMTGTDYVCAPTPPPDLDPDAWRESVARLRALDPRRLCLTHFGPFDGAAAHLDRLLPELDAFLAIGAESLAAGEDQRELTARLHARMAARLGPVPPATLDALEAATPSYMAAMGLTRYHTKTADGRRQTAERETTHGS
jgi:glyoxylase-like metal-dependent hydrolase (beta-lactamase superfamily II)